MIEVKFTCDTVKEFKNLLALLAEGNEEAASAYENREAPVETVRQVTQKVDFSARRVTEEPKPFGVIGNPRHDEGTEPEQPTTEEIAAVAPAEQEPEQEPQEEPAPAVSPQDLQSIGRKLAAAGKGTEVQAVLKAHGVKLLSKIPEDERGTVYTELQQIALKEGV